MAKGKPVTGETGVTGFLCVVQSAKATGSLITYQKFPALRNAYATTQIKFPHKPWHFSEALTLLSRESQFLLRQANTINIAVVPTVQIGIAEGSGTSNE